MSGNVQIGVLTGRTPLGRLARTHAPPRQRLPLLLRHQSGSRFSPTTASMDNVTGPDLSETVRNV